MDSPWMLHGLMALALLQLYLNFRRNEWTVSVASIAVAAAVWSLGWALLCFAHNLFTSDLHDWSYLNLWTYAERLAETAAFNVQILATLRPEAWTELRLWPGPQAFPLGDRIHVNLFLALGYLLSVDITPGPVPTRPKTERTAGRGPGNAPPYGSGEQLVRLATGHIDYRAYVDPMPVRNAAVQVVSPYAGGAHETLLQAAALFEYVKSRVNYVYDPITMRQGVREMGEYLASPAQTLEIGGGDCDDQALLMASLLSAVGIENRILFVESPSHDPHLLTEFAIDARLASEVGAILDGFYAQVERVPDGRSYLPFVIGDKVWLMADTTRDYLGDYRSLQHQNYIVQHPDGGLQWHTPPAVF